MFLFQKINVMSFSRASVSNLISAGIFLKVHFVPGESGRRDSSPNKKIELENNFCLVTCYTI